MSIANTVPWPPAQAADNRELVRMPTQASPSGELLYYDALSFGVEGQGWADVGAPYDRLPRKAHGMVRPRIWELSEDSTGLSVRFCTDATSIHARWQLRRAELAMAHMPATGVSGLDLYVKTDAGKWHWLAVGVPTGTTTDTKLIDGLPKCQREYLLYLPLYNGISKLEIGIPTEARITKPPARDISRSKPLVFYGTSITQGGCASRPGMCYPAILGRRLDRPTIDLGFSSNGTMDPEMASLISELDAAALVVDCVPNMTTEMVAQRTRPFVKAIRAKRPLVPILLVEDRTMADAFLVESTRKQQAASRTALRQALESLVAEGDANLAYLEGDKLLAADGEDTVDGSHLTDLGFIHISDAMQIPLQKLLGTR